MCIYIYIYIFGLVGWLVGVGVSLGLVGWLVCMCVFPLFSLVGWFVCVCVYMYIYTHRANVRVTRVVGIGSVLHPRERCLVYIRS